MHNVASCFVGRSNSVRKTRPFAIMGDDSPDPTAVFQRAFWLGPNSTGGLPSPIPEEFGPLNCGHSAAPAELDKTTVATRMITELRLMTINLLGGMLALVSSSALDPHCKEKVSSAWAEVHQDGGRQAKAPIPRCLTYSHMGMSYGNVIWEAMARAATTSDAFNAVAEPRRRDILSYLALRERPVGDIVAALEMEQPSVSKHLRVLKDVGLVRARREGRQILYSVNADAIRPLHEWASTFERLWRHQLLKVKERAEEKVKKV